MYALCEIGSANGFDIHTIIHFHFTIHISVQNECSSVNCTGLIHQHDDKNRFYRWIYRMGSKLNQNSKMHFLFTLFDLKLTLRFKIEGGIHTNFLPILWTIDLTWFPAINKKCRPKCNFTPWLAGPLICYVKNVSNSCYETGHTILVRSVYSRATSCRSQDTSPNAFWYDRQIPSSYTVRFARCNV